jgi:uncharacterized membrane protein YidH (DUF202 family)
VPGALLPHSRAEAPGRTSSVGVAFSLLGAVFIAYAYRRQQQVEDALRRGDYSAFESGPAFAFSAAGLVLGLATMLLIVFAR